MDKIVINSVEGLGKEVEKMGGDPDTMRLTSTPEFTRNPNDSITISLDISYGEKE